MGTPPRWLSCGWIYFKNALDMNTKPVSVPPMHVTQLLLPLSWSGQSLGLEARLQFSNQRLGEQVIELEARLRESEEKLFYVMAQLALINDNLNGNN